MVNSFRFFECLQLLDGQLAVAVGIYFFKASFEFSGSLAAVNGFVSVGIQRLQFGRRIFLQSFPPFLNISGSGGAGGVAAIADAAFGVCGPGRHHGGQHAGDHKLVRVRFLSVAVDVRSFRSGMKTASIAISRNKKKKSTQKGKQRQIYQSGKRFYCI